MRKFLISFLLVVSLPLWAAPPAIYRAETALPIDEAYKKVHEALEANRFWVVFEADLGDRMARFKDKWGDNYNRSNLSGARSMVFCNIWWTNEMASADPDMLALCPLHVSLYAKDGKTFVVMLRPTAVAQGGQAEKQAAELEQELIQAITSALK